VLQNRFLQSKQRKSKESTDEEQPEWPHVPSDDFACVVEILSLDQKSLLGLS
jgi:hypothetical protein